MSQGTPALSQGTPALSLIWVGLRLCTVPTDNQLLHRAIAAGAGSVDNTAPHAHAYLYVQTAENRLLKRSDDDRFNQEAFKLLAVVGLMWSTGLGFCLPGLHAASTIRAYALDCIKLIGSTLAEGAVVYPIYLYPDGCSSIAGLQAEVSFSCSSETLLTTAAEEASIFPRFFVGLMFTLCCAATRLCCGLSLARTTVTISPSSSSEHRPLDSFTNSIDFEGVGGALFAVDGPPSALWF